MAAASASTSSVDATASSSSLSLCSSSSPMTSSSISPNSLNWPNSSSTSPKINEDDEAPESRLMKALSSVGTYNNFATSTSPSSVADDFKEEDAANDIATDVVKSLNLDTADTFEMDVGRWKPMPLPQKQQAPSPPAALSLSPLASITEHEMSETFRGIANRSQFEANLLALARTGLQQQQQQPPIGASYASWGVHGGAGNVLGMSTAMMPYGSSFHSRPATNPITFVRRNAPPSPVPQMPPIGCGIGLRQLRSVCKFGHLGSDIGDFNAPHGFCIGPKEEIIVADTQNHRIQVFHISGSFLGTIGKEGKNDGELYFPRKIIFNEHSKTLVVCDRGAVRSRMQVFSWPTGHFLRRIDISFVDIVAGLAIAPNGSIVVVDSVKPTIFFIPASEANGIDGPNFENKLDYIDCSAFMKEPSDIAQWNGNYYICDFKAHRVVVIDDRGNVLQTVGNQTVTPYPNGIEVSDAGDILVGDSHGNQFHVAVFGADMSLLAQFTTPEVKVSRCCGLKITTGGWIVTLAKNNHHVLVLDKLTI